MVASALLALAACSNQPSVEEVSLDQFGAVVAAHRGQTVLVYAWAEWARASIEFLPSVVELSREYETTDTALILVRLDGHSQAVPAQVSQYMLTDSVEVSMGRLGLAELPAALVYDREGELRHRLEHSGESPLTPADIADAVVSVLP